MNRREARAKIRTAARAYFHSLGEEKAGKDGKEVQRDILEEVLPAAGSYSEDKDGSTVYKMPVVISPEISVSAQVRTSPRRDLDEDGFLRSLTAAQKRAICTIKIDAAMLANAVLSGKIDGKVVEEFTSEIGTTTRVTCAILGRKSKDD